MQKIWIWNPQTITENNNNMDVCCSFVAFSSVHILSYVTGLSDSPTRKNKKQHKTKQNMQPEAEGNAGIYFAVREENVNYI